MQICDNIHRTPTVGASIDDVAEEKDTRFAALNARVLLDSVDKPAEQVRPTMHVADCVDF